MICLSLIDIPILYSYMLMLIYIGSIIKSVLLQFVLGYITENLTLQIKFWIFVKFEQEVWKKWLLKSQDVFFSIFRYIAFVVEAYSRIWISGQNANEKRQHPKPQFKICSPRPQNPKNKSQWHFKYWRFVCGIQSDLVDMRAHVTQHLSRRLLLFRL